MALDEADFRALRSATVLVVGDSMLDRYWIGDVNRISPEAPVPVISVNHTEERLGGAANVARNIASMLGCAKLISVVGNDEAGQCLESLLEEAQIDSQLVVDNTIPTTVKLRLVSRNQQLVRADFEDIPSEVVVNKTYEAYAEALTKVDAVILSDYDKGGLNAVQKLIEAANEIHKPVYIDPKGSDITCYRNATMITPNLNEFQEIAGLCESNEQINDKAQQIMSVHSIQNCLVTLSENGMLLCQQGQKPIHQATRAREVYDVTGAGDTVIAMMALGSAAGLSADKTLELANHAAGVVVNKMGTATADPAEVLQSIERAN